VIGERERARMVTNPGVKPHGLALIRAFDVRDRLGSIASPALVCVGALDPITPVDAARFADWVSVPIRRDAAAMSESDALAELAPWWNAAVAPARRRKAHAP
jgi:hypothetical protein